MEFYRLPSYSPHLNAIERFWRVLRRATHNNRLFDRLTDLKRSIYNNLYYFQTVRSLVAKSYTRPANRKASAGS